MSEDISLYDLLNVSIGAPEMGAVNFSALHTLLHAMLGHMNIQSVTAKWMASPHFAEAPVHLTGPYARAEENESQELQTGTEHLERTSSSSSPPPSSSTITPVKDMWKLMQLRSRIQTNEDGVSKSMALIQDLLKEIHDLKEFRDNLKKEIKELHDQLETMNVGDLADRVTAAENCCHRMDELEAATRSLSERVQLYPDPEELDQCVTWDIMQSALLSERENLQKELAGSGTIDLATVAEPTPSPLSTSLTPVTSVPSDTSATSTTGHLKAPIKPLTPSSPVTPRKSLTSPRHSAPQKPSTPPLASPPTNTGAAGLTMDSQREDVPPVQVEAPAGRREAPLVPSALPRRTRSDMGMASGAERYPETLEALRNIGKLKERHNNLEARVMALETNRVDQAQWVHLKKLITNMGARDLPDNLMDQLNHQRALIDSLMNDREKNVELMDDQKAILQLQAECEKLHATTRYLVEDNSQKQSHIEKLYKSMEELEEKKADKQLVEMEIEIKADKRALESKVSRMQFDSMTEQLNTMFHELLSKVTGQEQDWHKVIDKLSTEMECKLNRIELDSVKKQLEDRWKSIHKKLQAQPAPEHEDPAGIRRQLVARFHCISCDRPVDMHPSGPHFVTVPSAPGLPSHKSSRPYSVYALEQVRQHYRSERIPEMTDYSYLAMSRSCGGSHTLTSPNQRYTRLQHITHFFQAEVDGGQPLSTSQLRFQPEEVDILGLDGHIYKGRLNTRTIRNTDAKLPTISTKEGVCKGKDKAKLSQPHKPGGSPDAGHAAPVPPHSAKSQRSRSASSSSVRDWPVSVVGCPSQSSSTPVSAPADAGGELHVHLRQEEEPVTNL